MKDHHRQKLVVFAKRAAVPVAVVVAFLLGGVILGGEGGDSGSSGDDSAHEHEEGQVWTCSMHPQIRSPEPGDCPICGMDLIPVESGDGNQDLPPDQISLSESARIRARIRTTPVRRHGHERVERRLLGRVEYDETRLRTVTSWISGRIDRLHVRTTGEKVRRGQVIATLYSPEVFSAHQDLLVAKQQVAKLKNATESARFGAQAALEASRDRLRLLGVPVAEIAAMEKAKSPSEQVRIRSPFGGTVIERLATEGRYVDTGTGLYQVADLSRVWVQLDAYESDLPLLQIGQEVTLQVEALPTETFEGRVTFVDPVLNQRTRTTRVRIEVDNSSGALRPNMFAEAVVKGSSEAVGDSPLVVPETAPLFTGRRSIVYVEVPDTKNPTYAARVVRLGPKMGDVYPVIAGLREGEDVVIHGAFTLDADLQIRGGNAMMNAHDDTEDGPYDDIVSVSDADRAALAKVLDHYLALHEALAGDDLAAAIAAGQQMAEAAQAVAPQGGGPFRSAWTPLRRQLLGDAEHLGHADSLDAARLVFRDLSQRIATLLRVFGNPSKQTMRLAFCPMALDGEGAEWVQTAHDIENPYFGAEMHSCGEVDEVVAYGTYLPAPSSDGHGDEDEDEDEDEARRAPAGGHQH